MMERIFPSTPTPLSIVLDRKLLKEPDVALLTVEKVTQKEFQSLLTLVKRAIQLPHENNESLRADFSESLEDIREIRGYLDKINFQNSQQRESDSLIALIHATDHIQRLARRCTEDLDRAELLSNQPELSDATILLDEALKGALQALDDDDWLAARSATEEAFTRIDDLEHPRRAEIYEGVARGDLSVTTATDFADSMRWLTRVSRHIYRSCYYLHGAVLKPK